MPRLSVIIPAYNAAATIARSAGSVLASTYSDLELIVVDDGSKDDTAAICRSIAAADDRLRLISQSNAGVSAARNRGMDEARGEYIAFVDADDYIECTAYTVLFEAMDSQQCDSAACGYYEEYADGARIVKSAPMPAGTYAFGQVRQLIVLPLLCDRLQRNLLLGTVWRYLFRTEVIRAGRIRFTGAYLEDEVFLIEYFSVPTRLAVVDKPLYGYLQNPQSVTKRYLSGFTDTFMRTIELKQQLVERFDIPVPADWKLNSAWAGLLIAVSNEYAPGNPGGGVRRLRELARLPLFRQAIEEYKPTGMNRNKTLAAALLRRHMYGLLGLLYTLKNRGRK